MPTYKVEYNIRRAGKVLTPIKNPTIDLDVKEARGLLNAGAISEIESAEPVVAQGDDDERAETIRVWLGDYRLSNDTKPTVKAAKEATGITDITAKEIAELWGEG